MKNVRTPQGGDFFWLTLYVRPTINTVFIDKHCCSSVLMLRPRRLEVFPHLYAPLTVSLVLGFSSRLPRLQDIIMTWSTHHKTDRRKRDIVLNSDWVCRWIIPSVCWAAGWASSAAERLAPHTATPADTHRSPPDMGRSVPHTRQVTRLYQVWKVKVWVLDIALFPWEDSCKQRFSLGSGSWLGWASGTAAHYGFSAN